MAKKGIGFCSLFLLLLLPGCARVFQWVDCAMYQGEGLSDQLEPARAYIRSVTVHKQIMTIGRFSAVWVSERFRTILADNRAFFNGYCIRDPWLLTWEREHNCQFDLAFYVVALKKSRIEAECSPWNMFLCVAGQTFCPSAIEPIEPCMTTSLLFRDYLTPFSTVYEVGFNLPDGASRSSILQLYFRTSDREVVLSWNTAFEHLYHSEVFCDWRALD